MRSRLLVLALCSVAACAVDEVDDVAVEVPPDTEAAALAGDPSAVLAHGGCYNNWVWNGVHARTYYPSNGGCGSSLYSPLVVIMPGNGFDQTHYHELAMHLARNRHIVVVVDSVAQPANGLFLQPSDYEAAAEDAWSFVTDFAWSAWSKRFFIDPEYVALVGHSRGGEAVRYLADQLAADPLWNVRAVVGLAGTDHTNQYLGAGDALAALYLHGSLDGDVPPARGYQAYDHTGGEGSQNDPAYTASVFNKNFKLLVGADHASFTNKNEGLWSDRPEQRATAKGYVLAFLKAHLAGDWTWFPDYVRGDAVPGPWTNDVYTQTADGFYKRVIDHFEDANNGLNALGASNTKSGAAIGWSSIDLGLDGPSGHDTLAMELDVTGAGWVQWNLPAGKRDASAFVALALRLGQRDGAPPSLNGVTVQIQNGLVWSAPLTLGTYGPLGQPVSQCGDDDNPGCLFNPTKLEHLATIRVPLADLGLHDDVRAVRLSFAGDAVGTELLIDSLELAQWVLAP